MRRSASRGLVLAGALPALLCLSALAAEPPAAEAHLLAGARAFRAGDFPTALVEFQVCRALGARGESAWYLAASLVKLGRPDDALEAFSVAEVELPEGRDALLQYYEAVACLEAHLLVCAADRLRGLETRIGPRAAPLVRQAATQVSGALATPPPAQALDGLLSSVERLTVAGRPGLANRYLVEAQALVGRLDGARGEEVEAWARRLRPPDASDAGPGPAAGAPDAGPGRERRSAR